MKPDAVTVFMLFYAIFWGGIFNVMGRWKAFQLPLFFRLPQARNRVVLSMLTLNVLPLVLFGVILWILDDRDDLTCPVQVVTHGVLPAFVMFGCYRLWLGVIECRPSWFYMRDHDELSKPYAHVEPTYCTEPRDEESSKPVVYLGTDSSKCNLLWGFLYVSFGVIAAKCGWVVALIAVFAITVIFLWDVTIIKRVRKTKETPEE